MHGGSGASRWSRIPGGGAHPVLPGPSSCSPSPTYEPLLTLSVKMTPNFQIWYLTSMDMSLCAEGGRRLGGRLRGSQMAPGLCRVVPGLPGEQPRRWFRLTLVVGCDLQRGQIHAQQLGNALPPIDVPMLVQHLYQGSRGHADTAGVQAGHSLQGAFWGHSELYELYVRNWGCVFLGRRVRAFFRSSGEGSKSDQVSADALAK